MGLISFLGIFYVLLLIGITYFYLREQDVWFKWSYFVSAIAILFLLVHFTYFQTQIDNNNFIITKTFSNGVDLNNLVQNGSHTYTSDTTYGVFNFWNIPSECTYEKDNAEFCFKYNNSDSGGNVIVVTNGLTEVSDYLYLMPNSFGEKCVHINTSLINHGQLLGINCLDCSVGNPFSLPLYKINNPELYEVHITKGNPESYNLLNGGSIHAFWVTYFIPPTMIVEKNFWIFMSLCSIFVLFFVFRFIYLLISDGVDNE